MFAAQVHPMNQNPTTPEVDSLTGTYIVVAHYQNHQPFVAKREMDKDMVQKLEKMGFKPFQIRIMFERFRPGKLMLEIENVLLTTQINHSTSPYERLFNALKTKYRVDFQNDEVVNKVKGVKDLQQYVGYLKKKKIKWTYLNIYDGKSKVKIGSLYADEPIPRRMIE